MSYYNKKYFDWQKSVGEVGGWANLIKFEKYIKKTDRVIDFGCGGGYLLCNINCKEKIGIEINKAAAEVAKANNIKVVDSPDKIVNSWADIIISNNVLEHVDDPLSELKRLYKKLRKGGKIIFVVPCESIGTHFYSGDHNQHMYSWGPLSIGNLFKKAGFKVIESKPFYHRWPPFYMILIKILGKLWFHKLSFMWGRLQTDYIQIRLLARK